MTSNNYTINRNTLTGDVVAYLKLWHKRDKTDVGKMKGTD